MLLKKTYGPVIRFKMSRTLFRRPLYFTTAYMYDNLLIDTGCPRTANEILRELRDSPLQKIVCTHSHEDHVGAAGLLKEEKSLPVKAHSKAIPIMADPPVMDLRWFQRQFWGKPQPVEAEALSNTLEIKEKTFEVIETPGHSPDHIVLFERETGFLFSGDAVVGGLDRAIRADFDIWGILNSLRKIRNLESSIIFSGSGRIIQDPQVTLEGHIADIEIQTARVEQEFEEGQSVKAIVKRIQLDAKKNGHNLGWVERLTRGFISTENLVRSLLKLPPQGF